MKLYLKQKFFSWKDRAWVKNEFGEDSYFIEGKVVSLGKKLRLMDTQERELAFIRQKVPALLPTFFIEIDGRQVAQIKKQFTFLKPKYVIDGPGWEVQGDFFGHDYVVLEGDKTVISIHKKWMSWGDSFELDIAYGTDPVLALSVVLAIDAVMDAETAAAASSST